MNKIPLAGSFELTPRCTLDCKMCYIHRRSSDKSAIAEEKDTKFWIDLATKARDAGMLILLLTGGEPLLRSDFDEIYRECKKLGLLVSVNTNATLLDEEKIRLFTEYPPQKINITLYGSSPETYGKLCGKLPKTMAILEMTADDELVLMHDETVDRTTDGTGKVCEMTLSELKKLDAGVKKGAEFAGTKIPTLRELFELVKDHPTITLDVELKLRGDVDGDGDMDAVDINKLLYYECN